MDWHITWHSGDFVSFDSWISANSEVDARILFETEHPDRYILSVREGE